MCAETRTRRRVLMLITQLGYGGAERSFIALSNALSRHNDVKIVLFTEHYGDSYSSDHEALACATIILDNPARQDWWIRRWINRYKLLKSLKCYSDVTISFLGGPNLLNALTADSGMAVVSERGSKRFYRGDTRARAWLFSRIIDPFVYRRADITVAISRWLRAEILEFNGFIPNAKIISIEAVINAQEIVQTSEEPAPSEFQALHNYDVLIACGRLIEHKGFRELIAIFAMLKEQVPAAKLLILGDGPDKEALRHTTEHSGLQFGSAMADFDAVDVTLAGYVSRPNRLYKMASLFMMTSWNEGLGNALLEAIGAGIPTLVSDWPGGGPRTLLSKTSDEFRWTDPTTRPLRLDYGTLMPPISMPATWNMWVSETVRVLRAPATSRPSRADRLAAIQRYDLENSLSEWQTLIDATRPT